MAERWKTMLGRVPEIEPDLERLRSLALDGPRLPDPSSADPERRIAIAAFAMAVAIAAVALVFVALREQPEELPAGERDPADTLVESGGTYLLSDFDFTFPVQSDAPGNDGLYAEVRFHTEWSTATWPGEADCEFRLLDRAGGVVASQTMGFSIDGPGSDRARVVVQVPTDAEEPVEAEGECGPGMVFDGSSQYVFSDLRIEGGDLVGDVAWSAGTPVGYAACGIHAGGGDGTEAFQVLGLGAGQGNDRTIALLGSKFPVDSTPEIRCEPYRLPEQFTRAYWMPWESGTAAGAETDGASPESPAEIATTPSPIPTAEEIVEGDWPLGSDLAQMLGLRREESFGGGCSYYVEVNDSGTGYCLEPLEEFIPSQDREVDLVVIGEALRGDRITAEQLERIRETLAPA